MKRLFLYFTIISFAFSSCRQGSERRPADDSRQHQPSFINDSSPKRSKPQDSLPAVLLKTTPIKNQGHSSLCWIYAMLATIESEHLMQGDSVNLSPTFTARMFLREQAEKYYLQRGKGKISMRGMGSTLIHLIQRYGTQPYDYYHGKENVNFNVLYRKVMRLTDHAIVHRKGLARFRKELDKLLDKELGYMPRYVHMLGAEYTSLEFAHSVCRQDEYVSLTSFTHHPFGKSFVLEVPDNQMRDSSLNVPVDSLISHIVKAVTSGHPVCWEGDISEPGLSFETGYGDVKRTERPVTQELRQRLFENFQTTDDHCMEIIGITEHEGCPYFICKNSYGTEVGDHGLVYLSYEYVMLKTIAVFMSRDAFDGVKTHG